MPIRLGTNGRMVFDKSVVQARNLAQGIHAERLRELSLGDACVGGTRARVGATSADELPPSITVPSSPYTPPARSAQRASQGDADDETLQLLVLRKLKKEDV